MKKCLKKMITGMLLATSITSASCDVMAAEAVPAAQIAETPVPQTMSVPVMDKEQYELALIQQAQMEILSQGLPLHKYNVINVLGDSITEGVGASTPNKAYPSVLSMLTGARVNNYGLSSSRITEISGGYSNPGSFIDRMYNMDKSADLIVVFGGTNDFWFGDCPIGKSTDTCVNTFYGALNTMIPYLKTNFPNADIVFITPYQQSKDAEPGKPHKRSTYGDFGTGTLSQYRKAMLNRCEYYGVPVLDLYSDFELNTVDNRQALEMYGQYVCDGCHLNDAGYNLLARKIYKFIMQDLNSYVPAYVEVNGMVFETAALPFLICPGGFVMPDGSVIASKPGFEVNASMPLKQIYQNLIVSAYY